MKQFFLFFMSLMLFSCAQRPSAPISVDWEFGRNDVEPRVAEATITIHNLTDAPLPDGWTLYFCMEAMAPRYTEGDVLYGKTIQGSYHCFTTTDLYEPIPAHGEQSYTLRFRGSAIRENIHPEGLFIVMAEGEKPISIDITCAPYTRREQMLRGVETRDKTPYADGEYVYEYVEKYLSGEHNERLLPLFPQPKKVLFAEHECDLSKAAVVTEQDASLPEEGYRILFTPETITLLSSSEAGAYYAQQTLQQLAQTQSQYPYLAQLAEIEDYPDMMHRGIMLDIVRNFYPMDSIKRVLDVMAANKLNVLHFHISDDEAWRVEIPGLPALTEIGARRGYTLTETECLYPMYCGGWDYKDAHSTANGFLSRKDYIELLRYAKQRHIRVIPEVDMPGHMRACKKALNGLLTDSVLEARQYLSAQEYTDNVIAVTNPYALTFIETVVSELKKMYDEAGCTFTIFNIGGDEVPDGALTNEEHQAFIDGVLEILNRYGLQPMGWEEITHFCRPESRAICYSWHNGEVKPMEMAEAGYPVVLATANHCYFDFAYCRHQEEKGLDWGGYTDEFRAFDWEPIQHENIIGMNAQLWAEDLRDFAQVEWQLYPKTMGLAERAWNNRSTLSRCDFTYLVYEHCLPLMHANRNNFHLQQPGIHIADNQVTINKVMRGGEVEYALFDLAATTMLQDWKQYTEPVTLPADFRGVVKARLHYLGKTSNTTWYWLED